MFGNFDTSWTSGFNPLNQINETLQKMKTDIEHNLESSLGIPSLSGAEQASAKTGKCLLSLIRMVTGQPAIRLDARELSNEDNFVVFTQKKHHRNPEKLVLRKQR